MAPDRDPRLPLQESLELLAIGGGADGIARYMSTRPAWVPGSDLPWDQLPGGFDQDNIHASTYGAHVYAMAGAAVLRAATANGQESPALGLHSIQGCFTSRGLGDRPFILDAERLSSGRTFATYLIKARQPTTASAGPLTPLSRFPPSDAERPLGPICFTALITLKQREPSPVTVQLDSAQTTYSSVLSSRPASSWPLCPSVDIEPIVAMFPSAGPGTFPIIDMRKVDMTTYNSTRVPHERKELLLYRLIEEPSSSSPATSPPRPADPNLHILAHAFAADRNGLLLLCQNFGFGWHLGAAATLSWSFYVHVNPEDAAMTRGHEGDDEGWWILENSFERGAAGRGFIIGRIYSPGGVHVATAVQDGLARAAPLEGKL